jgi:hypothetical protein
MMFVDERDSGEVREWLVDYYKWDCMYEKHVGVRSQ